jgi:hypothetical protein
MDLLFLLLFSFQQESLLVKKKLIFLNEILRFLPSNFLVYLEIMRFSHFNLEIPQHSKLPVNTQYIHQNITTFLFLSAKKEYI